MRKCLFLSTAFVFVSIILVSPAHARNHLAVDVKDVFCKDGKYVITFGVVNRNTYERTPTIAFKVLDGDRPVACKKITLTVPAESDGSVPQEIALDGPCIEGEAAAQARIYDQRDQNRAGPWLSDCP